MVSQSIKLIRTKNQEFNEPGNRKARNPHRMKRVRRTFTRTETIERLLVVSGRTGTSGACSFCAPGAGWLTVGEASEITGLPPHALLDLSSNGELHYKQGPGGVRFICAVSLSLKILEGENQNETHNS